MAISASETPVWLITGCSSGFGRALAQLVVDRGWRLIATARDKSRVSDLTEKAGDRVIALNLDVALPHQIEAVIASAKARFGRIDVLVNNAGYGYQSTAEEGIESEVAPSLTPACSACLQ